MRRLIPILLAGILTVTIGAATPAGAHEGGLRNTAVAINTKDGASRFRLAFAIHSAAGRVVTPSNLALAYARCASCRTVAIAFQVVLVTHDPTDLSPTNLALATNDHCQSCDTLASAYQFVILTGGPVRFTERGQRQIATIKRQLSALDRPGLSAQEIGARVDALAGRLQLVLDTQLVARRHSGCRMQRDVRVVGQPSTTPHQTRAA